MSRYIDSDVAIDKVDCLFRDTKRDKGNFMLIGYNHAVADCIAILKNLDAEDKDMVEVVRCKDCSRQCICYHSADYYCADGEKVTE